MKKDQVSRGAFGKKDMSLTGYDRYGSEAPKETVSDYIAVRIEKGMK